MAGMRALGRVYNVVPGASGLAICLKDCSGIGLLATASTTAATSLAFTAAKTYSGSTVNVTPGNGFGQPAYFYEAAATGVDAWVKTTASWASNVLTIGATAGNVSYVDYLVSELADGYDYLIVTATNATLTALLYDLTVQRTPENLRIPSA
jgi:hypothetical protein